MRMLKNEAIILLFDSKNINYSHFNERLDWKEYPIIYLIIQNELTNKVRFDRINMLKFNRHCEHNVPIAW